MNKNESFGFGPFVGKCRQTDDYMPVGACSDQNTEKENRRIRDGKGPIFKYVKEKSTIPKESISKETSITEAGKPKKKETQKFDTNIQKAIVDIAGNLEKSFRKFSKSTRDKAWDRLTSAEGEKEIKKILQNPNRQLNTFQKLAFKEWLVEN